MIEIETMEYISTIFYTSSFIAESINWIMYWYRKTCKVKQKVKPRDCWELNRILLSHEESIVSNNSDTSVAINAND